MPDTWRVMEQAGVAWTLHWALPTADSGQDTVCLTGLSMFQEEENSAD